MRHQHGPSLLVAVAMLASSCRKDVDTMGPTVRILSPSEGVNVQVPMNLTVRAEVSDDRSVKALTIDLLSEAGTVVASSAPLPVDAPGGTFERQLRITDERLASGTYTIAARASDGTNDGRDFVAINVSEASLRMRGIFLAPAFSPGQVTISKVDSLGILAPWSTVPDFHGIAIDSYWQHLIVAGSQWAPLQAIPTSPLARPWQLQPPANDGPGQFTVVSVDPTDRRVYVATRDGWLRGFTGEGVQQFTASCLPEHRCEAIVAMENTIATFQRGIVGGAGRMASYTQAGTLLDQLPLEHTPVAFFHRGGTDLVMFGNAGGDGIIEDINIQAGGTPDRRQFPGETIRAVARMDADNYAVALTGRLVRFNYGTTTVTTIAPGLTGDAIAHEAARGSLLLSVGPELLTIDPGSGTTLSTWVNGFPIAHILPLLNR